MASGRLIAKAKNLLAVLDSDIGLVKPGVLAMMFWSWMSSPLGMNTRRQSLKPSGRGAPPKKASYASNKMSMKTVPPTRHAA